MLQERYSFPSNYINATIVLIRPATCRHADTHSGQRKYLFSSHLERNMKKNANAKFFLRKVHPFSLSPLASSSASLSASRDNFVQVLLVVWGTRSTFLVARSSCFHQSVEGCLQAVPPLTFRRSFLASKAAIKYMI